MRIIPNLLHALSVFPATCILHGNSLLRGGALTNCTALVSISPFALVPKHLSPLSWFEVIPQALDYATSYVHSPSIMSFRDRGRFKQGVLYHQGSSYRTSAEGRPANPSVKSSLRLQGTYTMDGELIIPVGEKGVFLDCLG